MTTVVVVKKMHAVWDRAKTAREVASPGLRAGCEFDQNSGRLVALFTMKLNN